MRLRYFRTLLYTYNQCLNSSFDQLFNFIFLGVGKNFRLLMQSCCFFLFFFSRPFHENFKFLKNCPYDFHKNLHSHSTPKGAPACAKASKSYGWDVRNIAKISPKMAKKQPFFDFLTNCSYDSNESESEGKRLKPTLLQALVINNLSYRSNAVVFSCVLAICPNYCVRDCTIHTMNSQNKKDTLVISNCDKPLRSAKPNSLVLILQCLFSSSNYGRRLLVKR